MVTGQIITTKGKIVALRRTFEGSPSQTQVSRFRVGIGTATPALTDTDLANKVGIENLEVVDNCDATTGWVDSADMTISVNASIFKTSTGALNLTKDGTGSANASTSKTTTSLDFTSKDLFIWIYVNTTGTLNKFATTNCFEIQFGSDSTNFHFWRKDKSFFSVGWNLVGPLNTGNVSGTTGSPVITASDFTLVQLTATAAGDTWASGEVEMDDIKLVSSADYAKAIEAGYPIIDETALSSEIKCVLLTSEAEGNPLTEFGLVNTDATVKLFSRTVHILLNKTNTVQINYIEKDKIT